MTSEAYINIFNTIKKITGVKIEIASMNCDMEAALTRGDQKKTPAGVDFFLEHTLQGT